MGEDGAREVNRNQKHPLVRGRGGGPQVAGALSAPKPPTVSSNDEDSTRTLTHDGGPSTTQEIFRRVGIASEHPHAHVHTIVHV